MARAPPFPFSEFVFALQSFSGQSQLLTYCYVVVVIPYYLSLGWVGALPSQLGVTGHMNFEISVTDWAPERTTSGAISPPRLPDTTDGPTAEMRPKLEVTETS